MKTFEALERRWSHWPDLGRVAVVCGIVAIGLSLWESGCSSASRRGAPGGTGLTGSGGGTTGDPGHGGAGGMTGAGADIEASGMASGGSTATGGHATGGGTGTGGYTCFVIPAGASGGNGPGGLSGGAGGADVGSGGATGAPRYDGGTAALEGTYHCTAGQYMGNACFYLHQWDIVIAGSKVTFPRPVEGLDDPAGSICEGNWTGTQLDCCTVWHEQNGRICEITFRLRFMSANELIFWAGGDEPVVDHSARCVR